MTYWLGEHKRLSNATEERQREAFTDWYESPAKEKYREVRAAGGGEVLELEDTWHLFRKRYKPVGRIDTSRLPEPWGNSRTIEARITR